MNWTLKLLVLALVLGSLLSAGCGNKNNTYTGNGETEASAPDESGKGKGGAAKMTGEFPE